MHNDKSTNWLKVEAIIRDLIVASIIVTGIIASINILFGKKIKSAIELVDMVSINTNSNILSEIKFDENIHEITEYPEYGTRYGNIRIDDLDINLPLYYGDKLSILKNGVGQSSGAYFPGEGGSIICMGHNTKTFLYHLPEIHKNQDIVVQTTYGEYTYKVYQTKIVNMYDVDELPVQKDEEILMLYTCYPVNGLGHKKDRFVAFAKRIN